MSALFWFAALIILLLLLRVIFIFYSIHCNDDVVISLRRREETATMILAGSGGHTTEMLRLVEPLGPQYNPRIYVVANSDEMSVEKIRALESKKDSEYEVVLIPRSRKVHQSYYTSVLTTLYATLYSLLVVAKKLPDLIICNGPGTCIPICLAAFLLRVLYIKHTRIIFIESLCRVQTLSLSGKILYPFADDFIVQWPSLKEKYSRSKYFGSHGVYLMMFLGSKLSPYIACLSIMFIIHSTMTEKIAFNFPEYPYRETKRTEKYFHEQRSVCEHSSHCRHLTGLDRVKCTRECMSPSCYNAVYGHDELEEGEIDVRLTSFKGCFTEQNKFVRIQ